MCIWKTHSIKINLEARRKQCVYTRESSVHMNFLITVRCIFILNHVTLRRFNTIGTVVLLLKLMKYFLK